LADREIFCHAKLGRYQAMAEIEQTSLRSIWLKLPISLHHAVRSDLPGQAKIEAIAPPAIVQKDQKFACAKKRNSLWHSTLIPLSSPFAKNILLPFFGNI
jgi:hypothetical protein